MEAILPGVGVDPPPWTPRPITRSESITEQRSDIAQNAGTGVPFARDGWGVGSQLRACLIGSRRCGDCKGPIGSNAGAPRLGGAAMRWTHRSRGDSRAQLVQARFAGPTTGHARDDHVGRRSDGLRALRDPYGSQREARRRLLAGVEHRHRRRSDDDDRERDPRVASGDRWRHLTGTLPTLGERIGRRA